MKLTVYGCRGSAPFTRGPASRYGGNTACMTLGTGGGPLFLDAGSGLARWEAENKTYAGPIPVLLGHLHLDHTVGLAAFGPAYEKDGRMRIFTRARGGANLKAQVFGAFAPPYWPVPMERVSSARVTEIRDGEAFSPTDGLTVLPFAANHPDGGTGFRITDGVKTLVYLLDCETATLSAPASDKLAHYCRDADMLVFDATYHPDDYPARRGWGHSTVTDGAALAGRCGCRRMLFSHYGHEYGDDALDGWRGLLDAEENNERFIFAREGMEIDI